MLDIEYARSVAVEARNHAENFPLSEGDAIRCNRLAYYLDELIAEHERLIAEMSKRELHHFETETILLLAGIDPDGKPEWEYCPGWQHDVGGEGKWFVQPGVIAPEYVNDYIAEGGKVIRRLVGPWEVVTNETKIISDKNEVNDEDED